MRARRIATALSSALVAIAGYVGVARRPPPHVASEQDSSQVRAVRGGLHDDAPSPGARLRELQALYAQGLIDADEFARRREQILALI